MIKSFCVCCLSFVFWFFMDQNNFVIAEEVKTEIALSCTNDRGTIQINLSKLNDAWISSSTLPVLNATVEEISVDV